MTKAFEKAARAAKAWNKGNPEGIAVIVTKDDRSEFATVTRSLAWVMGEEAVIMVTGIRGCYLLSRVRPAPPVAA